MSDDLYFAAHAEFDDGGGGGGGAVVAAVVHDIIDGVAYFGGDFAVVAGRGGAAEVGGGGDEGAVKGVEEGGGEGFAGDADAYGSVVRDEGRGEAAGVGVDDGGGFVGNVDEVEGDVGDVGVGGDFTGVVKEDEHGFAVVAAFEGVDAADGVFVGGVAADAPDGVGGVEDDTAGAQDVARLADLGFEFVGHHTSRLMSSSRSP